MNCLHCYYAERRYDRAGMVLGVDCRCHNMLFIPWDEAKLRYCGMFAEADE